MAPIWLLKVAVVGLALVLAQPAAAEQGPARAGLRARVGIGVDLGALWRALASPTVAHIPGRILGVWDADSLGLDEDGTAQFGLTPLERVRLGALGLELALYVADEDAIEQILQQLQQRLPQATFGRQLIYTTMAGLGEEAGPPRNFAAGLIGAPPSGAQLRRTVHIGVVDGLPDSAWLKADVQMIPLARPVAGQTHASAVACVLACAPHTGTAGLARGARLTFVGVLAREDSGRVRSDTLTLARAFDVLLEQRVELVQMSLGGPEDRVLARVLARLLPRVAAFVAAGGNGGPPPFPATYPGVIAVAAVDAARRPWHAGTRGRHIAIAAPGVDLWLPVDGGRYYTGTSYAAPFVTAALAHALDRGGQASIAALCDQAVDLPPRGRDLESGCGLLRWAIEK